MSKEVSKNRLAFSENPGLVFKTLGDVTKKGESLNSDEEGTSSAFASLRFHLMLCAS